MAKRSSQRGQKTLTRRAILRGAAATGGAATLALVGCGSNGKKQGGAAVSPSPGASLDKSKGKPGGKLVFQNVGALGNVKISTTPTVGASQVASLVHGGLLSFDDGYPPSNGIDVHAEPDLAQALPEQPDQQTYIFKLKPAQFHDGSPVTAEDVKYSLEKLAFDPGSARKTAWLWLDHVDTPDAQTVVVKSKAPFVEALLAMAGNEDAFIVSRAFDQSPDAATKMMGAGPFMWESWQEPINVTLRKNPNYHTKPYPYFDEITILEGNNREKMVADFSARHVQATNWFNEELRDQLKQARPDARLWSYVFAGNTTYMRVDQPPFNDKRVRQALSMSIDRKKIRDAVSKGEGEDDQVFSIALGPSWGFRKPSQLGAAAKYWTYDPRAAKQLLSAAGITSPIEATFTHPDATFGGGQPWVDHVTLTEAGWKEAGIANIKDLTVNGATLASTTTVGNFDGLAFTAGFMQAVPGNRMKQNLWSPPEGITPPSLNAGHINNPELSALMEKQLTQFNPEERKQTLRRAEDIMAEEQYRIVYSTYGVFYFTDPLLRDAVVPVWAYGGCINWMKYWWFEK